MSAAADGQKVAGRSSLTSNHSPHMLHFVLNIKTIPNGWSWSPVRSIISSIKPLSYEKALSSMQQRFSMYNLIFSKKTFFQTLKSKLDHVIPINRFDFESAFAANSILRKDEGSEVKEQAFLFWCKITAIQFYSCF